jgi:Arc/MetJ-type ribon-helix-helix transcriptional regulator
MSDLASIARRVERVVGLRAADAKRIARKLNKLADSVSWATSISEKTKSVESRASPRVTRDAVFESGGGQEALTILADPLTSRLTRIAVCNTLSYVKESITVRLDKDVARLLARAVRLSGRTQSEVIRDALRRQLAIDVFDQMRRRVAPFAEAQGLLTDEDVFKIVS